MVPFEKNNKIIPISNDQHDFFFFEREKEKHLSWLKKFQIIRKYNYFIKKI